MKAWIADVLDKSRSGRTVKAVCYKLLNSYAQPSYAQEGEDRILQRLFERQSTGFYIDVGAHHPLRFSNTYLFYKRGWKGINIDATPGSMRLFEAVRPRDCNLELAIGEINAIKTFFMFNEPALNTFDAATARDYMAHGYKVVAQHPITVSPLGEVLRQYVPEGCIIDFLSVDVEGLDLEVLRSNNWQHYRPRYVITETLHAQLDELMAGELARFLSTQGYKLFAKTSNTSFFMHATTEPI